MAEPIREALERLVVRVAATYDPDGPVPAWADSYFAALAALAAEPPAPDPAADGEREELARWLEVAARYAEARGYTKIHGGGALFRAAALLRQPADHGLTTIAPLLWLLWHHQGARSSIGQPIRRYLGIEQFERLTPEQITAASQYQELAPAEPRPRSRLQNARGSGRAGAMSRDSVGWAIPAAMVSFRPGDFAGRKTRHA